jgi:gamma-glutamylcyclotransferase (GGCT)/AIG2-like uncharacterized protein YtfP
MKPNTHSLLKIFVYGTLKHGFSNHDYFCRHAVSINPALTWGRLYDLPYGFPALAVPPENILAHGSDDPLQDTILNSVCRDERPFTTHSATTDWDLVHGELICFDNPKRDLPPIDDLEGFEANGQGLYQRVLVTVQSKQTVTSAWTYRMKSLPTTATRLTSGRWVECTY